MDLKNIPRNVINYLLIITLLSCAEREGSGGQGRTVFRYNEAAGISSLDPAYAKDQPNTWVCNQLFDGLVKLDSNLRVQPSIARSWTISGNGTVYTFDLRTDVKFHTDPAVGNRSVKASDFVYSFERLIDPATASPGAWVFRNVSFENDIPAIRAVNDSCLEITLNEPFPAFLGMLSMQYCSVVPEEAVILYGEQFRKHPVGTGPFRFKMWKEGVKLVLVKNESYFMKDGENSLPYLDAVSISFLGDMQSAFLEFVKGNLDFLSGIDPAYKDEILTSDGKLNPKYEERFYLLREPFLNTEYLGILVDADMVPEDSPLLDPRIRKALNMGFDRERMVRYLRNNIGKPGDGGIIPPGMPAYDPSGTGYSYDPDRARELITEAGYVTGRVDEPLTIHTTSDYLDVCKYLQHQLGETGFDIEIEVQPAATIRELKAQAKLGIFRASWIADYPDEENYLSLFYSENFTPEGPNYTHFSNPEFDRLYEEAVATPEDSARTILYRKMNEIIFREAPCIILYYDEVLRFIRHDIKGLETNPMNMLDLRKAKKKVE